ncbi:hypothetical protein [Sediminibacterium sp.]|uniref:hypothetical protein n=1 Tax=Sediminibacterium sp. TaxID=1917865 RepID=UPI003F71A573
MDFKHYCYLLLVTVSSCFGKNATAKSWSETDNYRNHFRILSAKGIVFDAPMVKDKETRKRYNKSLQEGWGYSGSDAKRVLNGLEKEGQPEWIQDGITEAEEKIIQSLNGWNVQALTNEFHVLEFYPHSNQHIPEMYQFKKPFCLVVEHYHVVLSTSFSKIQQTADTSTSFKKMQAFTKYPVQLNKLSTYTNNSSFTSYLPFKEIKTARMKKHFQIDSLELLRTENANVWPKGITTLSTEDLKKLKAYYLFSFWNENQENLYIRIPAKENAAIFPQIGFIPNHDLYYTIQNDSNYITWAENKPPKDFRIKNIIEVMRKAMIAYADDRAFRSLYKPGSKWDINDKGAGMIPTDLYVLNPKAAGQVIHRKDKLSTYQLMIPLEKSVNRFDAEQTAFQLAKLVAEEASITLKPGEEPIEFYLSEPRNINGGKLYVLQYKKDALLGNNQYQVFAIMCIDDVVWLNYIFRNEIYGYLF